MAPLSFSQKDTQSIRALVDQACSDAVNGLPLASVSLVGDGQRHKSQLLNYSKSPKQNDTSQTTHHGGDIYWLASCTKLVTSIACMQLIEKQTLHLDDADLVEKLCPELKDVKVLQDNGILVDKTRRITLRMLLTHTSGFGYSFLNPCLKYFRHQQSLQEFDEFSGHAIDFDQPLIDQPGENFRYGISMDWAGVIVERATGLKLNDYMTRHIFEPLGIQDLTMNPSADMKSRLAGLWQRDSEGTLSPREYLLPTPRMGEDTFFQSGGAGLFGSLQEFSKLLRVLLNDGTVPETGQRIISTNSIEEMFTNQLAKQPNFARKALPTVKPDLVYEAPELYPLCPPDKPQGWGLSFLITPGITGRSDDTVQWSGLSNIFWWCDRSKGIAGVVGSQVLPFVDPKAVQLWVQVEQSVYAALENAKTT